MVPLVLSQRRDLPDVPKPLTQCFKSRVKAGGTANERVINLLALAEERKLCGQGILKWYGSLQKANS
jgi:hypothetical protein